MTSCISFTSMSNSTSSSNDSPYNAASFLDWQISGSVSSVSHFETVCLLIPNFSATSSWDIPFFLRAWNKWFPKLITLPPWNIICFDCNRFKEETLPTRTYNSARFIHIGRNVNRPVSFSVRNHPNVAIGILHKHLFCLSTWIAYFKRQQYYGTPKLESAIDELIQRNINKPFEKFMLTFLKCDLKKLNLKISLMKYIQEETSKSILKIILIKLTFYYKIRFFGNASFSFSSYFLAIFFMVSETGNPISWHISIAEITAASSAASFFSLST